MTTIAVTRPGALALLGLAMLLGAAVPVCGGAQPVRLRSKPQAGFQITPLVHQIDARPGQSVPFAFHIRSRGDETNLRVRLVGLEQTEDGRIHASDAAVPAGIRLQTPEHMTVEHGDAAAIRGNILVPMDTNYVVFGVQVTDAGRSIPASASGDREQPQRQAQINFVTQYLLRVEIRIHGGRGASVTDLQAIDGGIVDRNGLALAQMYIENSTPTAVEFEAQARLIHTGGDESFPLGPFFSMHHPARANEPEVRRRHVRILGGSRIAVEALVPDPVFEGRYQLEVRLVSSLRRAQHEFPITVAPDDFPAQRTVVARVVNALQVSPPVLELSDERGGNRMTSLTLHNVGSQIAQLNATVATLDGGAGNGITVRPNQLTLQPGQRRNIAVTMTSRAKDAAGRHLLLQIRVEPEERGAGGSVQIPVAVNVPADAVRDARIHDLRWIAEEHLLAVEVSNEGASHLVLDGEVEFTDALGRSFVARAGFGQWLLPEERTTLRFKPIRPPPPGPYDTHIRLNVGPSSEPYTKREPIEIR